MEGKPKQPSAKPSFEQLFQDNCRYQKMLIKYKATIKELRQQTDKQANVVDAQFVTLCQNDAELRRLRNRVKELSARENDTNYGRCQIKCAFGSVPSIFRNRV